MSAFKDFIDNSTGRQNKRKQSVAAFKVVAGRSCGQRWGGAEPFMLLISASSSSCTSDPHAIVPHVTND
jgi:hypothetical protein